MREKNSVKIIGEVIRRSKVTSEIEKLEEKKLCGNFWERITKEICRSSLIFYKGEKSKK